MANCLKTLDMPTSLLMSTYYAFCVADANNNLLQQMWVFLLFLMVQVQVGVVNHDEFHRESVAPHHIVQRAATIFRS